MATSAEQQADVSTAVSEDGVLTLTLSGRLDAHTIGRLWRSATLALDRTRPEKVVVDASGVDYCDGAGVGLLLELQRRQRSRGARFDIRGLASEFQALLEQFDAGRLAAPRPRKRARMGLVDEVGFGGTKLWADFYRLVAFVGEMTLALVRAVLHPRQVRWKDTFIMAEKVGVNALPIIILIGGLMGLILGFQSAMTLRDFGAEVFVANLIAVSLFRELGPLITAIILTGRSGSAFAAELGTMTVTEEIDALTTMGLEPMRFLVVPRVIAAVVMMPFLTIFFNFFGLLGGGLVMAWLNVPPVTYVNQVISAVDATDLLGGLLKAFVLGILVAAVGCLRGLQTTTGPTAVGDSTTGAVVSGIVLIAVADAAFAIVYYSLGI